MKMRPEKMAQPTHLVMLVALLPIAATLDASHLQPLRRVVVPRAAVRAVEDDNFPAAADILAAQRGAKQAARDLALAVSREDYAAAATLKSQLENQRAADPVHKLRVEMAKAIKKEEFDQAATIQAELSRLRVARPGVLWRDEILVLASGGKALHLLSADGQAARTLYSAPVGAMLQQPVFSLDGERVAVAEVYASSSSSRVLVLSTRDGTEIASAPTPPVFFLYFSPAEDVLLFLHPEPNVAVGGPTLVLGALDLQVRVAPRLPLP